MLPLNQDLQIYLRLKKNWMLKWKGCQVAHNRNFFFDTLFFLTDGKSKGVKHALCEQTSAMLGTLDKVGGCLQLVF